jgi:hypothetical protein
VSRPAKFTGANPKHKATSVPNALLPRFPANSQNRGHAAGHDQKGGHGSHFCEPRSLFWPTNEAQLTRSTDITVEVLT